MCSPWKPGDRIPAVVVSTVTVACPSAKSRVAFATGVPSAVFSCVVRLSVPGAGLLEVVEELGWLDGDVQALNTATAAVSSAAATVTCFNMTAAYPEPPSVNRATRVYPPAKQDDGTDC
jgi:hypothetical protein